MSVYVIFFPDFGHFRGTGGTKDSIFGSRVRALCRLNKLGVYFTQEKQEAILRGDTSNSVVHRNFMDAVQSMGMVLCGYPGESPTIIRLHARYAQRAWESMVQLQQTNQERSKAQALVLLTHTFVILGLSASSQVYFLKACKIIEKEKFRFIPEYGLPVAFSEQVRENACLLSQAIYLENFFYLAMGGSAPVKTARIEREFRCDLQVRTIRRVFAVGSKPI